MGYLGTTNQISTNITSYRVFIRVMHMQYYTYDTSI